MVAVTVGGGGTQGCSALMEERVCGWMVHGEGGEQRSVALVVGGGRQGCTALMEQRRIASGSFLLL